MFISYLMFALSLDLATAHETAIKPAPQQCEEALIGSDESIYRHFFSNWEKNYLDGLGVRGFMGNGIPNTPLSSAIGVEHGLSYWGLKIVVVPSIEEAQKNRRSAFEYHSKKKTLFTDQITSAIYILGGDEEFNDIQFDAEGPGKVQKELAPARVKALLSRGGFEIDETGAVSEISAAQLLKRIGLAGMTYNNVKHLPTSFGRNSLSQPGWVTFKKHGLHDYSTWKETGSARHLQDLAARLVADGFTIKFNHDYKACLEMLKIQERSYTKVETTDSGEKVVTREIHDVLMNRYQHAFVFNTALARLLAGEGYSVEVYSPEGKLVGGEIGFRSGNHVFGESVFYDRSYTQKTHGFDGVELAKLAALALMEHMLDHGMPYTDPGMITAYTHSMGAEFVDFPEFRRKITSGPKELIAFPEQWSPKMDKFLAENFAEVMKRRNQAAGTQKVLARWPMATESSQAAALAAGLTRVQLTVKLVADLEAAKADAATYSQTSELPLYLLGKRGEGENSLSSMLAVANEVVWFKSLRHLEHSQKGDVKKLKDMLLGKGRVDAETVVGDAVIVPVWGLVK